MMRVRTAARCRQCKWLILLAAGMVVSHPGWGFEQHRRATPSGRKEYLDHGIKALLARSPGVDRGRIGFKFADVETGAVVAEQNAADLFTPASNTKLYTTALALARLGPDYRFKTQIRTAGTWKPGQPADGLELVGGGDPNLSGRRLPYRPEPVGAADASDNGLAALKQMADQVCDAGLREVDGDVVGVAGRYGREKYPDGWTLDDSVYGYGAPVSALTVNDNLLMLTLRPSAVGDLSEVELEPKIDHFAVLNQVVTDGSNTAHVAVERIPGSNELVLRGTIGQGVSQWREEVALEDGALVAAEALVDLLRERGVLVTGTARARYDETGFGPFSGTVLAERVSQPLSVALQVINKVSQNLHAEMLLREVAFVRTGEGSLQAGLQEREAFLQEVGVSKQGTGFALDDGSGLARQDLTSPDSTVALLRAMWARPDRDIWVSTLPIGGLDGSLQHRFKKIAGAERVRAKTGSLSHVNALSGYLRTATNRTLAFSIMVNGTASHESDVREFLDRLCGLFLTL